MRKLLPKNIYELSIPVFDKRDNQNQFDFTLKGCIPKNKETIKNINSYDPKDMIWILVKGVKEIKISNRKLQHAMTGIESVVLEIYSNNEWKSIQKLKKKKKKDKRKYDDVDSDSSHETNNDSDDSDDSSSASSSSSDEE